MELVTLPETKQMDRQGEQQNGNATAMHTKETDKAERTDELTGKLLDIWEASLRTTHHFLAETDIELCSPAAHRERARQATDKHCHRQVWRHLH